MQAPEVYLIVWIAVDAVSVVFVILFWIIHRYVFAIVLISQHHYD